MKKIIGLAFVVALMLTLTAPAFAGWEGPGLYKNPGGQVMFFSSQQGGMNNWTLIPSGSTGGTGGSADVDVNNVNTNTNRNDVDIRNNNLNTNKNTNIQGQIGINVQEQEVNNDQTIAPVQSIVIEAPERPLLPTPVVQGIAIPQLSFGEVKMISPMATDARLKEWNGEVIVSVVVSKKTTAGKVIKKAIDLTEKANQKEDLTKCRVIWMAAPSTKMWSTGGNISVGGANTVGTGGMSGAGGLIPSYGRMTADTIIYMVIVRVVN